MTSQLNVPSSFFKTIKISITKQEGTHFLLEAYTNEHQLLNVSSWLPFLFFRYTPNFFGLTALTKETEVLLSSNEIIELFSTSFRHPFVQFDGVNEQSSGLLEIVKEASSYWYEPSLWRSVTVDEEAQSLSVNLPLSKEANELLEIGVAQKLNSLEMTLAELPKLLPFFQTQGWPTPVKGTKEDIIVALRLREPDELSDEWILETVIRGKKRASYWAPPARKRKLSIEDALPEKWKQYASFVEQKQEEMSMLLLLEDHYFDSRTFISAVLSDIAVREFLLHDFVRLQALGYEIVLPAWLKDIKETKMKVRATAGTATNFRSTTGLQEILTFNWQLSLNGQELAPEQFEQLVNDNREFIRVGTEWFKVDATWVQELQKLMAKAESDEWTVRDLLFQEIPEELSISLESDEEQEEEFDPLFQLELQQSLKQYIKQLQDKKGLPKVQTPTSLNATLRPYQQEGFEWLVFMREQNFGACLADDMGLGKTVQLISYLLHIQEEEENAPSLIVCPTSVLGNWQKEIARFAPSLKVYVHYGPSRLKQENLKDLLIEQGIQVVLSTYGTVTQDADMLQLIEWSNITLDEAQNIKNMETKQSRAIRKLKGKHHIALTGTPVENRLSELWAIFDFIYKGYLGSFRKFQENFIAPIERDLSDEHKSKLRAKINPFLLRRTKQDPELLLNLPEKLEQREYCPLTSEQAVLYESFIQESMQRLQTLSGFEKKGLILKMLSKLKQLCNHPSLYLKEPFDSAEEAMKRSEKLNRIVTLANEIAGRGEQCLIFTQYIGMGHLLQHCLSELYDIDVPFLTGSMPKHQRDHFVEAFQNGDFPIFILSLKAGGTGLNLTAANHVLHADRWWNPAVENQATDRAYRIGQTQFVHVHKFITTGTIEEKIDELLTEKLALSEELIQSSQWITELQDEDLQALLTFDF